MEAYQETESRWAGLKEVTGMAWPIIVGMFSFIVMQFTDQVLVAQLGEDALAAVGPSGLWLFALSTFFLGIVGCVGTFVSQSLGRGEPEDCARYAWQAIYVSVGTGILAVALWPAAGPIFAFFKHSPEVTRLEVIYFQWRLLGFIFIAWQGALVSFFQAVRKPGIPTIMAIIGMVLNVGLDFLLIFGLWGFPRLEVAGAAIATVISLGIQVILLQAVFLSRTMNEQYQTRRAYALDMTKLWELFRIGWPSGFMFFMDVFNWGIFTSLLVGGFGTIALASHNAAINLMHVAFMPAVGLNHAISPIVGQWIGRGDIPRAKARTYTAMRLAMAYMFTCGIVFAVCGRTIIYSFFSQAPEVLELGHTLLILAAVFQAFDAVNITVLGALRGAGDTRFTAVWMFILGYFFFLPAAWFLAVKAGWGAIGCWVGATMYIIVLSFVLFARFRGERWRHIRIFAQDLAEAELPADVIG